MLDFTKQLELYRDKVNAALDIAVPEKDEPAIKAMRYSLFAGGKRIRACMILAFCEMLSEKIESALAFACAIEMIHTYSLIFDDLPCMDNDTLRRGKPTNHVVFGESTALMSGVALYGRAFEVVLESSSLSCEQKLEGTDILLAASGLRGIVTGQMLDLENRSGLTSAEVMHIHELKTSAMIEAAAKLGCVAANCDEQSKKAAVEYAKNIGLAFQIKDDILDVCGTAEKLGKTPGKDKASNKTTFVDILGIDNAQTEVERLTLQAKKAIDGFKNNDFLLLLADSLAERKM